MASKKRMSTGNVWAICFIIATVFVTICSKSSFLYPLNDWVDANCFFTVGKSIRAGVVPYRDLFEQKGPLLYFLYAIASVISYDTFFGVYIIEIVCSAIFLFYSAKLIELYSNKNAVIFLPLLALVVYTSPAFTHGGSAEELCMPFISASLYYILKAVKCHTCPTTRESLIIGILSVCVFWMKFTLVGIYVGWFLVFSVEMLFQKKFHLLWKTGVMILVGVVIGTIPYAMYFCTNHAMGDLIEVYIYDNIFKYTIPRTNENYIIGLAKNIYVGIANFRNITAIFVLILAGGGLLFIKEMGKGNTLCGLHDSV